MNELLSITAVLVTFAIAIAATGGRLAVWERQILGISALAHILAAFAQVWITRRVYGYGDMLAYHASGQQLAALLRWDFFRYIPDVAGLLLHQNVQLPIEVYGGDATGAMIGISGILSLIIGDSLHAVCLVLAGASCLGKLAAYRVLRGRVPVRLLPRVMAGFMLVPSVVFWTSGLLKEAVAMTGLGYLCLGAFALVERRGISSPFLSLFGFALVGVVKAYILFPFFCAFAVWFYRSRALRGQSSWQLRPIYVVGAVIIVLGALVGLSMLFPEYAFDQLVEQTAHLQELGGRIEGGSNYQLARVAPQGVLGQLAQAPIALLTALFRPSLFDVRNGMMFINAIETTALAVLLVYALATRRWRSMWHQLTASPSLMFCAAFAVLFATAVGLATTNFGTLSRYRAPLMPFFVTLVVVWTVPPVSAAARARARSSRPA